MSTGGRGPPVPFLFFFFIMNSSLCINWEKIIHDDYRWSCRQHTSSSQCKLFLAGVMIKVIRELSFFTGRGASVCDRESAILSDPPLGMRKTWKLSKENVRSPSWEKILVPPPLWPSKNSGPPLWPTGKKLVPPFDYPKKFWPTDRIRVIIRICRLITDTQINTLDW